MTNQQEKMNKVYQFQSSIYDLTRKFYLLGRDTLLQKIAATSPPSVLEIGCGTGRNLFKLYNATKKQTPPPLLAGFDICDILLYQGEMRKRSRHSTIHFVCESAETFDYQNHYFPSFSAAFCSYSLSMIPNTKATLETAHRNLTDKGLLYIIDFYDFNGWPAFVKRAHDAWLNFFHVRYRSQMYEEIEKTSLFKIKEDSSLYGGYARLMVLEKS